MLEIGFNGNNITAAETATTVTQTPPPDLEVALSVPTGPALASNELLVSFKVTNFGSTETPNSLWTDNIYLSQDSTLDIDSDFLIGSETRTDSLAIGDSYFVDAVTRLPDSISGEWFVIVATDANDDVFELANDNNIVVSASTINVESRPADLAVTDITAPSVLAVGQSLLIDWTVSNVGTGATEFEQWRDQIILSTDDVFGNDDDISLGFVARDGGLVSGDSYSVQNQSIAVPFDTVPGDYFVFVVADAGDVVFEDGSDGNNVSAVVSIAIEQESANLVVDNVSAPPAIVAGQTANISWAVSNEGPDATAANLWIDAVYLSQSQTVDDSAILLDRIQHSNPLDVGEQYTGELEINIPLELTGDWFVVVQTDVDGNVRENDAADNFGSSVAPIAIGQALVPDLVISNLVVASSLTSGRTIEVSWTVRNDGQEATTSGTPWVDSVYLSLNNSLDRNDAGRVTDRQLGFATRPQDLAPGEEYTQTASFFVPAGLSGPFFLFVAADGSNVVNELEGESNNLASQIVSVELPLPVDFVVGEITVPENGVAGQQVTIDYTVENQSVNTALGSWVDSIYLSADGTWDLNDPLVGRVEHSGDVAGGSSYSETLTASLPGVLPGDYQVIIRSDILNRIIESDETNNAGASLDSTSIDFPELVLDTATTDSVTNGESVYYQVQVEAGETLFINASSNDSDATAEVFISYDRIPTRAEFDFAGIEPFESNQSVTIPITEAGTYYVLVSGSDSVSGTQDITTNARLLQFESIDADFGRGGNVGNLTIELNGAKFDRTLVGRLTNEAGIDVGSQATYITDSTKAYLTFDLRGLEAGDYDVVLENQAGESFTVADSLEVVVGGGSEIIPTISVPEAVALSRDYNFEVTWLNNGLNDAFAPVLEIQNDRSFGLEFGDLSLGTGYRFLGTQDSSGPSGVFRPGQSTSQTFFTNSGEEVATYTARVNQLFSNPSEQFDWEAERDSLRPADLSDEEFEPIFQALIAQVGETTGDYLAVLSRNASLLPDINGGNRDVDALIGLEVAKVRAQFGPSVSGFVQDVADIDEAGLILTLYNVTRELDAPAYQAIVLNDGSFLFGGVAPGEYRFSLPGGVVTTSLGSVISVNELDSVSDLELEVGLGKTLQINFIDATTGAGIETDVNVWVTRNDSFGVGSSDSQDTTDSVQVSGLENGLYTIAINSEEYAQQFVEVDIVSDGQELTIELSRPSEVSFTATIDGEAVTEEDLFFIAAVPTDAEFGLEQFSAFVSGDNISINDLAAGTYDIVVTQGFLQSREFNGIIVEAGGSLDLGEIQFDAPPLSTSSVEEIGLGEGDLVASGFTILGEEQDLRNAELINQLFSQGLTGSEADYDRILENFRKADPALQAEITEKLRPFLESVERWLTFTFVNALFFSHGPQAFALYATFLRSSPDNLSGGIRFNSGTIANHQLSGFQVDSVVQGSLKDAFDEGVKEALRRLQDEHNSEGGASCKEGDEDDSSRREIFNIAELGLSSDLLSPKDEFKGPVFNPGLVAGGLGTALRLDGHNDRRDIQGKIIADISGDQVKFTSLLTYLVTDSVDFVKGDFGSGFERNLTLRLGLLEAFGFAAAVKYQVKVNDLIRFGTTFRTTEKTLDQPEGHDPEDCPDDDNDDSGDTNAVGSVDPNDILGPNGFGVQNFIAADQPLNYTIRFENDPVFATAPAQVVTVRQTLDSNLDYRTFRVGDFAIGDTIIDVPENRAFYADRIDLTEKLGVLVDVSIGIDVQTGEAFWNFTAIDPATGDVPEDPFLGLLAPNVTSPEGEGFAKYSVQTRRDAQTGDVIDAQARIVFDINDPIDTPPIFHTLDAGKPESSVAALPLVADESNFLVSWDGRDDEDGAAIADYTIYVSVDGGDFSVWLPNTNLTSAIYVGEAGRDYAFYSVARDNAGNIEAISVTPDAATSTPSEFGTIGNFVFDDANANGLQDSGEVGVADVTVDLYQVDSTGAELLLTTTQTTADGTYLFSDLDTSGEYFIEYTVPAGFALTNANQGDDDEIDSDADVVTRRTDVFSINAGDNLQWDAGIVELGEIGGFVWQDDNANAIVDADESLLPGVTIFLDDNNNGTLDSGEVSTVTDSDGAWSFIGLRPGQYFVTQLLPEGFEQTFPGAGGATSIYSVNGSESSLVTSSELSATSEYTAAADLIEFDSFSADSQFDGIDGSGYSVVVIDTGIDVDHSFFGADEDGDGVADRIVYQYDFADGDADASDIAGHGSNVSSIIASEDSRYQGIASGVDVIHLKVFKDNGTGAFSYVEQALQWVVDNVDSYNISAVNLSVGDGGNWTRATGQFGLADELATLANLGVITVAAAGNNFGAYGSQPGVAYPAADPNAISVGAIWDVAQQGPFVFESTTDYAATPDQIASFSQRHADLIDTFAPGTAITGANATGGTTTLRGTSQAVPFVTGTAVLAQQIANQSMGRSLTTSEFRTLLQQTGDVIVDGDDELDNVENTGLSFTRLNVHALALAISNLDSTSSLDSEVTVEPPSVDSNSNETGDIALSANQPFVYTIDIGSGEQRTDVNFGIRLINAAPEIDTIADQTIDEGETLNLTGTFDDINPADQFTATIDYGDGNGPIAISLDDKSFELSAAYDNAGNYLVVIEITDLAGATGTTKFTITVENLPPEISVNEPSVIVNEGSTATTIWNVCRRGCSWPRRFGGNDRR